jgi:iron complex transport system ATP-binding protein
MDVELVNLEAKNINIDILDKNIVKDISISAKKGEFVGIIGPNGCGKSTFLKSIYRAIKPKSGAVYLDGSDILKMNIKTSAKKMAVVGQFNNVNFDFTVEQMVLMGRTPHKRLLEKDTKEDYNIAYEALKQVSMESYASRSFSTLSGGEKQRIVLARAIAQQPEFLILDEPTNHLDIKYQLQILSLVKKLNIGVVAALHDLNLAFMYCTKLYVMKNGHVISSGEPREVLTKELIRKVYEVDCEIEENNKTGCLTINYYQA